MQMQKIDQALEHTNLSVLEAELNMNQRAGQPQAVEVLSITLGELTYLDLNNIGLSSSHR